MDGERPAVAQASNWRTDARRDYDTEALRVNASADGLIGKRCAAPVSRWRCVARAGWSGRKWDVTMTGGGRS